MKGADYKECENNDKMLEAKRTEEQLINSSMNKLYFLVAINHFKVDHVVDIFFYIMACGLVCPTVALVLRVLKLNITSFN